MRQWGVQHIWEGRDVPAEFWS